MKSMVWAVFQYGVEGWTLRKSDRNRIESFEMWCWRKMLGISWKEHRTNISILEEIMLKTFQFITVCKGDMNRRKPKTAKIILQLNLGLYHHVLNSCCPCVPF